MAGYSKEQKIKTAKRLKELRVNKGLSHIELAEQLSERYDMKISRDVLMNYEVCEEFNKARFNAGFGMRIQYLAALADFYNVSTEYLLGNTDVMTSQQDIKGICEYTSLSEKSIYKLIEYIQRDHKYQDLSLVTLHTLFEKQMLFTIIDEISKTIINTAVYNFQQNGTYTHSPDTDEFFDDYFEFSKWKFSRRMIDLYEQIYNQVINNDENRFILAAIYKIYSADDRVKRLLNHLDKFEYDPNEKE